MIAQTIVDELTALLGPSSVLTAPAMMARYLSDQRELLHGKARAVIRPQTTEEIAKVVTLAGRIGFSIVPQAGNTSYCGGATPDVTGHQVVMSFERHNKIRRIDLLGFTASVDAGLILDDLHKAIAEFNLSFGLSLGSQGSCQIGGNIATNAGGISVLRYGMMRDLVLGLEVVLPNGEIFEDMTRLRKNNTGYDLKQLFIGSEGTLGFVAGAVLKLHPAPTNQATAWVELGQFPPFAELLGLVRRATADLVTSFEYIANGALDLPTEAAGASSLRGGPGGALIVELSASTDRVPLETLVTDAVGEMIEQGWATDAQIASSGRQQRDIWKRRELIPECEKRAGGAVKHDISVPLDAVASFITEAEAAVEAFEPALNLSVYGHVGDGNIHFNVLVPAGEERLAFSAKTEAELSPQLFDIALKYGGTFSAEHGVGRLKRPLYDRYSHASKRRLSSSIKTALDPSNCFNCGAVTEPLSTKGD
jgi:FAD/FMN-containing dehydrogenase